jgi:hypothetical protein
MTEYSRSNTRKTLETINGIAKVQDITTIGFLRDKKCGTINGIIIGFLDPIKESDIMGS